MNRGSAAVQSLLGRVVHQASMRPRFMNRGSDSEQRYFLRWAVASMRPRFMNRGSDRRAAGECLTCGTLQ